METLFHNNAEKFFDHDDGLLKDTAIEYVRLFTNRSIEIDLIALTLNVYTGP